MTGISNSNQDPTLDEVIAYVVGRALDRDSAITKTKLAKLLYLADVARARDKRRLLTGLKWTFFHYGPYAFDLEEHLDRLAGNLIEVSERGDTILYVGAPGAPSPEFWPDSTRLLLDRLVDEWATEPLNALLDYVYFETEPMLNAERGEELDFSLVEARSKARPDPGQIKPAVREQLHELALNRSQARLPATTGRRDEIWEQAMAHESELDGEPLTELIGEHFRFTAEAANALADESE